MNGRDRARDIAIAAEVARGVRTLADIGNDYGITWERVRQVAKREGVTRNGQRVPARPRVGPRQPCRECGERVPVGRMRQHRLGAGHSARHGMAMEPSQQRLAREFYERGLGYTAIGTVMGLPAMTIKRHLMAQGVAPHQTGHYPRDGSVSRLRVELADRIEGTS